MRVLIRHFEEVEGRDCGEMNPDQLQSFLLDIRRKGVLYDDADGDKFDGSTAGVQYIDSPHGFCAEIIYGVE